MTELPSGTVTFLFTDIEGSTALLKQLGRDRYDEALAEHGRLLRAAVAAHDGRVVDTQGDSFFVAFRTAADAVAAAVDVQRDLAARTWPGGAEVKVRMGLHTGEPKVGEERYVGIGVHRAARIGAAGHGGQVLLSSTSKELAEEELPPGVSIRDLGERRLKDIDQPQSIFQLVIDDLQNEFARLKTLDVELRRKRRRVYAGAALIGVMAAAVAVPIFAFGQGGSGGGLTVNGNAVADIDPSSNEVVEQVSNVGARPGPIAFGSGSLWVGNLDDETVARIDPSSRSVLRSLPVKDPPTGLATSAGSVWIVASNAPNPSVIVRRLDPRFDTLTQETRLGNVVPGGPGSVATRGDDVWVAPSAGLLTRLSPRTAEKLERVDANAALSNVAVGPDAVWITDSGANNVVRVDPTGLLAAVPVGHGPTGIAIGEGSVWVAETLDNAVVRIDPETRVVIIHIPVGRRPLGLAIGDGSIWVANSGDGTVSRIDPDTEKVTRIRVGGSPQAIALGNGHVWVTVQSTVGELREPVPGGTISMVAGADGDFDYVDPALAYHPFSWQLLYATCAKLLNYPDKPAPAGSQLEPEVASSLPRRSADGKTYTFTIRKGYQFSPPSNESVTAETFKYAIERSLSPRMKGWAIKQEYLTGVVGAKEYIDRKARHIRGIVAKGDTLTVRFVTAGQGAAHVFALPFFCAVPIDTPLDPKGIRSFASAGPYYVSSYTPGEGVVLRRNPNYRGSRPHRPERIVFELGNTMEKATALVEAGEADYQTQGIASQSASRVASRYGPGSAAAKQNRQRFFTNPRLGFSFFVLNQRRPLFRELRLRQAVNYALDRRGLARLGTPLSPYPDRPTDQYLPPGIPGFTDARIYPSSPDVATARRLAGPKHRSAVLYICDAPPCDRLAQIVKANLGAIDIDVQVKEFPFNALFRRFQRKNEPYDLAWYPWLADYPDPDQFLDVPLLSGGPFPPLEDPVPVRKLKAAARLSGPPRYLRYGKLDADLARNAAPFAAVSNFVTPDFFSPRIGCQVYHPVYGMDLAALCIRKKS